MFPRTLLAFLFLLLSARALQAADRPNVLFLFSDDQRFDTIHALGNDEIRTPHLDGLVKNGFAFTHAFCMGSTVPAVCAPSRSMLMTGRTLFQSPIPIPKDMPTWPEVMRQAGYSTYGIGKWHNGPASFNRSFGDGGNIFFGGMNDHRKMPVHDYDPSGKYDKQHQHFGGKFSSELFADRAIDFLRGRKDDTPFFLYVAHGVAAPRISGDTRVLHGPRPDPDARQAAGKRRVELVVSGAVAAAQDVAADDKEHELTFSLKVERSSSVALRHFPQLHTNPVNVVVGGRPIRASRQSARWCAGCVEQLWRSRGKAIAAQERDEAQRQFQEAIRRYRQIAAEAPEGS